MKYPTILFLLILSVGAKAQFCTPDNRFTEVDYFSSAQIDSVTNLTYASYLDNQGNQQDLLLDFYFPGFLEDSLPKRPFILLLHGGGFFVGNKGLMRDKCFEFAKKGFVAATMNYRLGNFQEGDVRYRAQQDAHSAMRFVVDQAETYRIDTTWLFIGGRSSGSMAALGLAYLDQNDWNTIDSSSVSNLGLLNTAGNDINDEFTIKGVFNNWGNVQSAGVSESDQIPMIAFHGENDPIVRIDSSQMGDWGSRVLHEYLVAQGICSDLTVDPNGGHGVYDNPEGAKFRVQKTSCFFKSIFCEDCSSAYAEEAVPANCASATTSTVNVAVAQKTEVFPNPSTNEINILTEPNFDGYFEIYNLIGERLLQSVDHQIDIRSFHPGAYILVKRYTDGRLESFKLIKK
ncbi:alpha/beta hydrolase fold domain-containing protein [Phaeodactylibacter sp.]|uniref:alpha/beta hydrolase fold domain-containing protein n=1 Tax=Phaeodactylibacter sp. TaxID=1940289 RepID=UPI0025E3B9BB|nr:alpha/beta hydrolase fold domain-containing protein [Phaeodactylibacter sp.]MCI4648032.1 alpha/beta hydrolase fold domain-containing protein [Phaeodactylibacter sp.]MCI5091071.1 alpha/beta hydrolase fold domain-containing protein [Phaeodactylibacter sp.]